MKLVLYSGGRQSQNRFLHQAVSDLVGEKKQKTITYVPFCFEGAQRYFNRFQKRYSRFGFEHFHFFPVDRPFEKGFLEQVLESDAIYLAGGNTFYFLKHLQQKNLLPKLRAFVRGGGVLAGLSAGAIILTPNIRLAGFPDFDRDEDDVNLEDLSALSLTQFEFFPHFQETQRYDQALRSYTKKEDALVFACRDGSGVVIDGDSIHLFGKGRLYENGVSVKLF